MFVVRLPGAVERNSSMRKNDWPVTEDDVPPAGKPGECFWCKAKIGLEHNPECVRRDRTIVVEVCIKLIKRVPESWEIQQIENHYSGRIRNCAGNITVDIDNLQKHLGFCLCDVAEVKYIREATEEDEEFYGVSLDE